MNVFDGTVYRLNVKKKYFFIIYINVECVFGNYWEYINVH